jgi:multicomponent Na+:H+ antiporter subunit B
VTGRALLLERATRPLYGLLLVAAVWILLRGHNAPGGGFIGGLVAVAGTAAYAMVFGATPAQRRLPLGPMPLALLGAALALLSGLPALALGRPYLTHLWWNLPLGFAELPLSTVLVFDVGVFLAVWGTLAGYVLALLRGGEMDRGGTP